MVCLTAQDNERPPNEWLLDTADELSDEDAGGHGDHLGILLEDVSAFFDHYLREAIEKSVVPVFNHFPVDEGDTLAERGEPKVAGLLYNGQGIEVNDHGLMAIIEMDVQDEEGRRFNEFTTAFPLVGPGLEIEAEIGRICLFPNRLEARLELIPVTGGVLFCFDTMFWRNRTGYKSDEIYRFVISALAYDMKPVTETEIVIDDPQKIRKFRATQAWSKEHGHWSREEDLEDSLAAWKPESPEDLEPIKIFMGEAALLMPSTSGPSDDASYQGEVKSVTPKAVQLMGVDLWKVDTVVMRKEEEDLVLPIYIPEHAFEGNWRPTVGTYVTGLLWMQGYAAGKIGQPH